MKDGVVPRSVAAALLLGAFAVLVFSAATQPAFCPPPFAGSAHAWLSCAILAAILLGAVFFEGRMTRALAWAAGLSFCAFEAGFALPAGDLGTGLLPTAAVRGERGLQLASVAALGFLLFSLPSLFDREAAR